jgi:AcrR family transcriptional regulator
MEVRQRLAPQVRRRQILDTAVHMFYESGYDGASLRNLSSRVGINKATIYHYFPSKEDILFHIIEEVGQSLLAGLLAASKNDDSFQALKEMVHFQILYIRDNLEHIKVLVEDQKSLGPNLAGRSRIVQSDILRAYEGTLQRCINDGKIRKVHCTTAAFAILGQINWLYHWYKPEGPLPIEELAVEVASILLYGLAS